MLLEASFSVLLNSALKASWSVVIITIQIIKKQNKKNKMWFFFFLNETKLKPYMQCNYAVFLYLQ